MDRPFFLFDLRFFRRMNSGEDGTEGNECAVAEGEGVAASLSLVLV
jgi:hypothetical protein